MEDLSIVTRKHRVAMPWPDAPYLLDHRFLGKAVLPAVESMEILARAAQSLAPTVNPRHLLSIDLVRFLPLDGGPRDLFADISIGTDGTVRAELISSVRSKSAAVTRSLSHVTALFGAGDEKGGPMPMDMIVGLPGIPQKIDRRRLYDEMVPFGPAYHNADTVYITPHGASMCLSSGQDAGGARILGSPFTLDAAFHGACAWGQSLLQFVGFPVALQKRTVHVPTAPGKTYFARLFPGQRGKDFFTADILIFGDDGTLHESVAGLTMRDTSGGRLAPPAWISGHEGNDPLSPLSSRCQALTVMDLEAIPEFAAAAFTPAELARYHSMAPKRKQSYRGSRIACKLLSRKLAGDDTATPPQSIETIAADGERPALSLAAAPMNCTVSHDCRFVAAAASHRPAGIDVEQIQERLATTKRFYVKDEELSLTAGFPGGELQGLARVWTIKEAVAKALGTSLACAWTRTLVISLGETESGLVIDGRETAAFHGTAGDHCFTLVIL